MSRQTPLLRSGLAALLACLCGGCGYYGGYYAQDGEWAYAVEVGTAVDTAPCDAFYAGDTVECSLVIRNASAGTDMYRYTSPGARFWVTDTTGRVVWDSTCDVSSGATPLSAPVPAHSELVFTATWELVDDVGWPVADGTYLIYAQARGQLDSGEPLPVADPAVVDVYTEVIY
ncbi:MAG: hypothetical protein ACOCZK_03495 [Planctomycetota bacterium]